MSQQKPEPTRPRPRRVATQSKTPPSNGSQLPEKAPARPAPDDREGWKTYWEERQQSWRTEPEIDAQRQEELATRRALVFNIEKGIYPFGGIKLTRADVEWLLATHDAGKGPINWNDQSQRERRGLNLRGADLRQVDLSHLPLALLYGGLRWAEWERTTEEQHDLAGIHLEGANLNGTHLQEARLRGAHLEAANLRDASLEGAFLYHAHLEGATLFRVHLERANLIGAHFEGKSVVSQQQGFLTSLPAADLRLAFFDSATSLEGVFLGDRSGGFISVNNAHWGGVNLTVVNWADVDMLGDERKAREKRKQDGGVKSQHDRLAEYEDAVRAYRQLTVTLRNQGLNEAADRFAYRANMLQRKVLWFQIIQRKISLRQRVRKLGAWVFSHLLNLVAGYGYRPERSLLAYLLVIFGFMGLYLLTSHFTTPHLRWDEALVLSLSSFHGRGFFTQTITLGDPYARLAVTEAVLGLFIEISFIATFTQRFFGK